MPSCTEGNQAGVCVRGGCGKGEAEKGAGEGSRKKVAGETVVSPTSLTSHISQDLGEDRGWAGQVDANVAMWSAVWLEEGRDPVCWHDSGGTSVSRYVPRYLIGNVFIGKSIFINVCVRTSMRF